MTMMPTYMFLHQSHYVPMDSYSPYQIIMDIIQLVLLISYFYSTNNGKREETKTPQEICEEEYERERLKREERFRKARTEKFLKNEKKITMCFRRSVAKKSFLMLVKGGLYATGLSGSIRKILR